MTMTNQEIVEDCEGLTKEQVLILGYLAQINPATGKYIGATKTSIMHDIIRMHGDIIEHAPYIYGEYSDDIDQGITSLKNDGAIYSDPNDRYHISDYGERMLETVTSGLYAWDEEVEKAVGRLKR